MKSSCTWLIYLDHGLVIDFLEPLLASVTYSKRCAIGLYFRLSVSVCLPVGLTCMSCEYKQRTCRMYTPDRPRIRLSCEKNSAIFATVFLTENEVKQFRHRP